MKKILVSILLSILISVPVYSSEKIVYLDVEKIMQQSIAGKSIIAQLKKKREESISKFKKKEKDIIDKEKKLIAQKNVLSKEEFETKIIELRKEISNYQKERNKTSNSLHLRNVILVVGQVQNQVIKLGHAQCVVVMVK